MALIKCPDCSNDVSDSALKCPKCGVQLRKPTRSGFGKVVKWVFILFNLLMGWWFIAGMSGAAKLAEQTSSSAEHAGAVVGTGLGAAFIIGIWGFGDVILGLFVLLTRPKS